MANPYLHADGWDHPAIDLVPIEPQPRSSGMQVVQRDYSANLSVHEQGLWMPLEWSAFESPDQYYALLLQLNLVNNLSRPATLWLPDPTWVWRFYNGTLHRPEIGPDGSRENYFLRGFTIRAVGLVLV